MDGLNCHRPDFDISTDGKYYKETSQYRDCMDAIREEYYPDGNNFICHQSLIPVPQSECVGYGYMTIDDQCYKFSDETRACIAEKQQKDKLCDQHLEDVTSKIEKNIDGYSFEQICEVTVNILGSTPAPKSSQTESFFIRIIDFIRCPLLKLFGKTC